MINFESCQLVYSLDCEFLDNHSECAPPKEPESSKGDEKKKEEAVESETEQDNQSAFPVPLLVDLDFSPQERQNGGNSGGDPTHGLGKVEFRTFVAFNEKGELRLKNALRTSEKALVRCT